MKYLITILAATAGTAGFALIFRVNKRRLPFAVLGGTLSCCIYILVSLYCPYEFVQYLIPAAFATAYAESFARILKTPASTLLLPSIIPLVPGGSLYYTMSYIVAGDMESFYQTAYMTIEIACGIAAGIMFVSALVHSLNGLKVRRTGIKG